MCGRFATAFLLPEKIKSYFQLDVIHPFIASFNIAPSLLIPAIRTIDQTTGTKKDSGQRRAAARPATILNLPSFCLD